MVRKELLRLIVLHAVRNGFDFQQWYTSWFAQTWHSEDGALEHLATAHNYYELLFSHVFARAFWQHGSRITFRVPSSTFMRRNKNGELVEVKRKAYTRRRLRRGAWKYHLREMSVAEEPLKYIRRFVLVAPETAKPPMPERPLRSLSA